MKINLTHFDRVCVLEPHGQMVHPLGDRTLREVILEQLDGGYKFFVINMAAVPYIDSAGVGELVASLKRVRESGGDLAFAAVSQRVSDIFMLLGLVEILELHGTEEEAIASFV